MSKPEALTREVAFLIAAATQQLPGVSARQLVAVLLGLTQGQLTLEGLQRIGARALRDAVSELVPVRSADATRAVAQLRRQRMPPWCRVSTPNPDTPALAVLENSIRVGFASVMLAARPEGTGEGILLVALRVEEDREVTPDLAIAEFEHLCGRGADHHIIPLSDRTPEQAVPYRAANQVGLHRVDGPFPNSLAPRATPYAPSRPRLPPLSPDRNTPDGYVAFRLPDSAGPHP